ncbi:hypothetical protein DFH08DRAFT_898114 [Mycena albidolilacea]|uniref:Uncharacterized protein n=1 Tax=Mycena albidolilacea TaxID=1033008 RepID=A0AAD6Z8N3_9AGAR|nr:hypothetical protein DFH08DRAFT_898114 [Mycena albidolilacea]
MESPAPDSNDLSLSGPHPKVHVVGLLATTDLKSHKDRWRGVDFAAFRDLFSEATHSIWLTAAEWDDSAWKPIIGDPHAQRLELPALPPVAVVSLQIITAQFLLSVGKVAATAQEDDTVVIVLCGHGDEDTGHLVIGGAAGYRSPLSKEEVELALADVRVPRRRIFVVTIACYSGQWRSEAWTLFAAADRFQTSAAMTTSASGEGRGSMFTYALLAERADGHGLTAPHPVCKIYPADHVWKADSEEVLVWDAPWAATTMRPPSSSNRSPVIPLNSPFVRLPPNIFNGCRSSGRQYRSTAGRRSSGQSKAISTISLLCRWRTGRRCKNLRSSTAKSSARASVLTAL